MNNYINGFETTPNSDFTILNGQSNSWEVLKNGTLIDDGILKLLKVLLKLLQ